MTLAKAAPFARREHAPDLRSHDNESNPNHEERLCNTRDVRCNWKKMHYYLAMHSSMQLLVSFGQIMAESLPK